MTETGQFQFAEPGWLWLAVLGPLALFALQRLAARRRHRQLATVASPHALAQLTSSHSPLRRHLKDFLLLLALGLAGLTLARPQWGRIELRDQWLAEDAVFVLDCSRSMLATDVQPNRLQRAKYAILNFVQRQASGRVGLVAFAGSAFLQCPLTFDYEAFEDALRDLDERTIPVGGTDIGRALNEAIKAMEANSRHKLVVLITDGEDLEKSGIKAAETLAKEGAAIYAIGVGTEAGAELRALNASGQMDLLRDARGEIVRSQLDEKTLAQIATAGGGGYFPLGRLGEGLMRVQQHMQASQLANAARSRAQAIDRYYVTLALLVFILVVESLLGTRRGNLGAPTYLPASSEPRFRRDRQPTLAAIAIAFLWLTLPSVADNVTNHAKSYLEVDLTATRQKNPASLKADESFGKLINSIDETVPAWPGNATNSSSTNAFSESRPRTARDFYNLGTRQLAREKLTEAESMLRTALVKQDERVQPLALYNLGHVRFQQGAAELKKTPEESQIARRIQTAEQQSGAAISSAQSALAANDLDQMIEAYQRGRVARREIKAAREAVKQALEAYAKTLERWRRAAADFRSAAELNPDDKNARQNIERVEQAIAELIDRVRKLMQMMMANAAGPKPKFDDMMKQLKGRIPEDKMPPGAPGDDEEDNGGFSLEELKNQMESPGKQGEERELPLSPEEAGKLLDGFRLDGSRRLPMAPDPTGRPGNPRERKLRDW
jgi:Ca-activated chloride channel family protein